MPRTHNVCVPTRKYKKDGEEKTFWLQVGSVIKTEKGGRMIKLDSIPTAVIDREGNSQPWDGWLNLFPIDGESMKGDSPAKPATAAESDPNDNLGDW